MGSCIEELWPSFRTSESDGIWKRDGTQEELGRAGRKMLQLVGAYLLSASCATLPVRVKLPMSADAIDSRLHILHSKLFFGYQVHFVLQRNNRLCFYHVPQYAAVSDCVMWVATHQKEGSLVRDELHLCVSRKREDGHSVVFINSCHSTQEATQRDTET